ncbi:hypothetical protein CR513_35152, partial [Mucuna pruriens]
MQKELSMIERNQTWELVPRSHYGNVIGLKRVIDYLDIFAPITRHDTIRLQLTIVAQKGDNS